MYAVSPSYHSKFGYIFTVQFLIVAFTNCRSVQFENGKFYYPKKVNYVAIDCHFNWIKKKKNTLKDSGHSNDSIAMTLICYPISLNYYCYFQSNVVKGVIYWNACCLIRYSIITVKIWEIEVSKRWYVCTPYIYLWTISGLLLFNGKHLMNMQSIYCFVIFPFKFVKCVGCVQCTILPHRQNSCIDRMGKKIKCRLIGSVCFYYPFPYLCVQSKQSLLCALC